MRFDGKIYASRLHAATDGVVDSDQQNDFLKQTKIAAMTWTRWFITVLAFVVLAIGSGVFLAYTGFQLMTTSIILFVGLFVIFRLHDKISDRSEQRALSRIMLEGGYRPKLCLRCGYNLQGTFTESCPECGEPLAPPKDDADV